ncbi:amidase [Rhodococcus sp. IEGM 248]|uniref:amidase n=1 Tax=Rhodococcus opacus TaxID=37919 RepID=UPI0013C1771E|nr:amidase [Rhodococcus opacus]MDV7090503.1 amidase [Rhodococcus opacus]NDV10431.1 amidase [Rhodococcus sp. IEGM 248]
MNTQDAAELGRLTARRTAELVRSGELSPTDTVDAAIVRIEESDAVLNAVVFTAFEQARAQAHTLTARLSRGEPVGLLAGVPTLTKDSFSAKKGWPTSAGLSILRDDRAQHTTNYPRRMEAADAIMLGTTNSAVFGFRGTTDSKAFGPCRNPHDPRLNAGGSSGGSAAAVAAGYVPIAGATDVGGSIRIPSAWCGTYGFQPTPGRAPFPARPNHFGPSPYFFEGPITRTVEDAALAMEVLQGYDSGDPAALPGCLDFVGAYDRGTARGLEGIRVGVTTDYGIFPVHSEIRDGFDRAVTALHSLGAEVVDIDLQLPYSQSQLSDVWSRLTAIGTYSNIEALAARGIDVRTQCPEELPEPMMRWVEVAASMTIGQLVHDQTVRSGVFDAFERAFTSVDLLMAPTVAHPPVPNAVDGFTQGPSMIEEQSVDPLIGWCMAYLTNFTGNPSASLPSTTASGLPMGIQITGRPHGDLEVIAASAAFEQARLWTSHYNRSAQGLGRFIGEGVSPLASDVS